MTPADALITVTSVAPQVCGLAATKKGRIAECNDGDILAIGDNPFTEPEAIHRIRAVCRLVAG